MSISFFHQQANSFLEALGTRDVDTMSKLLSEDFKYYRHPRGVEETVDRATYLARIPTLTFYVRWNPNVKEPISVVENEKDRQIVILHYSSPIAVNGKTYNDPQYVWFFHFDGEGKIDSVREYVDTVYLRTVLEDWTAHRESSAAKA
ncbi:hypothetical protein BC629DRAFT_1434530 [Irpex lacteus]|nr:hypothetical protein BC629DRAFT_1434530 [Irpex lacteus]